MKYKHQLLKYGEIVLIIVSTSIVVADIVGILMVEDQDPIRQTISQLTHSKYSYIQDIGLTVFEIGILLGMALYVWKSNFTMLKLGAFLLSIIGICIVVLAEFNQFAGKPGTTIHIVLAVVIGLLYLSSYSHWYSV
jgi:energy-converting hydrogenase Eha subunit A